MASGELGRVLQAASSPTCPGKVVAVPGSLGVNAPAILETKFEICMLYQRAVACALRGVHCAARGIAEIRRACMPAPGRAGVGMPPGPGRVQPGLETGAPPHACPGPSIPRAGT